MYYTPCLKKQELSKPRLATPLHAYVLVTYLLSYLGTYLFTRLLTIYIYTAATAPESSPAVLVMIRSKSVSICNHSRARLVDSSRNHTFSRGYPNLMRSYGGLLEPRGSSLTPLKSTFNAEHFVCTLSWSILNGFSAIQS